MTHTPDEVPHPTPPDRRRRTHLAALVGVAAMIAVGVLGWWAPWSDPGPAPTRARATSSTTTSILTPDGPVAPLTGLNVPVAEADRLARPALVVKVDGDARAMPQLDLSAADQVVEVEVEEISRYLAVYHSAEVGLVGPVRSARTSDPDLLAAYGEPVFAFSGGNRGVLADVAAGAWIQDASEDAAPSAYHRAADRRAPHNLIADAATLWAGARVPVVAPTPLFTYRALGSAPPGRPVVGVAVPVGSDARFVWDAARRGWLRWAHGRPHTDSTGHQLAPTNVVVLHVDYVPSSADGRSPEAISVGNGPAWVLSGGAVQVGSWSRPDRRSPWVLRSGDGSTMTLDPGTTWVVLADGAPALLDAAAADALPRAPG